MSKNKSAVDTMIDNIAEEQEVSTAEASKIYEQTSEYTFDFDRFKSVRHNWVKRGIKVSCEGADHPHHSHFLVGRR